MMIDIDYAKRHLNYDEATGIFIWVNARRHPALNGRVAGTLMKTYLHVSLKGRAVALSRIAWTWHYGQIPDGLQIDHINRVRTDNRLCNLRVVTGKENMKNTCARANKTGYPGVQKIKNSSSLYRAYYRGTARYFKTAEEAATCYQFLSAEAA